MAQDNRAQSNVVELETRRGKVQAFAIGDLDPALEQNFLDLLDAFWGHNGEYYELPVSFDDLTKLLRANAHHESAAFCKKNTVVQGYRPGPVRVISRRAIEAVVLDYIYTGNFYLQKVTDRLDRVRELRHLHARTMRRHRDPNRYLQLVGLDKVTFRPGEVIHGKEYAPESSVYGLPEYLGSINSLLLNEAATLFRRKFYYNGAHMGFLLVSYGEEIDDKDVMELKAKIKETKGVGNFRNLYVHLPVKSQDGKMELLPVGDFAKDDFEKIKTISRDDIISAHRVPPQILSVLTDNKLPATGDLDKIVRLYNRNVVVPIQLDIAETINEHLDQDQQISFDPYLIEGLDGEESAAGEATDTEG